MIFTSMLQLDVQVAAPNPAITCLTSGYTWTIPTGWTMQTSHFQSGNFFFVDNVFGPCITVTPDGIHEGSITCIASDFCGHNSLAANPLGITYAPDCSNVILSINSNNQGLPVYCICSGVAATFTANITGGRCVDLSGVTYSWSVTGGNGGWTISGSGSSVTITPNASSATVYVTAHTPCGDITTNTNVIVPLTSTPYGGTVPIWGTDLPHGAGINGSDDCADAYQWQESLNGGSTWSDFSTSEPLQVSDAGHRSISVQFRVRVHNCNGWTPWAGPVIVPSYKIGTPGYIAPTQQLSEDAFAKGLLIKPNPTNSVFEFTLPEKEAVVEMNLVSSTGAVVKDIYPTNDKVAVDVKNLSSGSYYLVIRTPAFTVLRTVNVTK